MSNQKKGIVYTVTNNKTDKVVYVGITTKSVKSRKQDHIQRAKRGDTNLFQEAIATLGVEAFKWESDNTLYDSDTLAEKEKELIEEYKKSGNNLLNKDKGGGVKKSVFKYNVSDGSLIGKYNRLMDAAKTVNSSKQQISRACINKTKYKEFYWSYKFEVPFKPNRDFREKQVIQFYPHSWNKVSTFKSVSEASRVTKINKGCIAKCCRKERKSAGGFRWRYL